MLKQGIYKAENGDSIFDRYEIGMEVKETEKLFIFKSIKLDSQKGECRMKVCLYARVASLDQTSLDCQVERLKEFAGKHDLEIFEVAAECGSGIRDDRPELSRVEALAADGKFDAVVATNMSRLFRNTLLYVDFEKRMENCGVKIFTLDRLQRLP